MNLSRRSLVGSGIAVLGLTVARAAAAERLYRTAAQPIGPFYPVGRPLDQDADLTRLASSRGVAKGQIIEVTGRVLTPDGRPVPNARLDIWQANAAGRYAHPGDNSAAPLDPNFQGSALLRADAGGRYRYRTVKPGAYEGRTPHIHLDVTGRTQRLVTQMYFPNEPLNASDGLLTRIPERFRHVMTAKVVQGAAVPTFAWDIVLEAA
jgi:protocatechuate 3,4-dioxygenase, beta subunit